MSALMDALQNLAETVGLSSDSPDPVAIMSVADTRIRRLEALIDEEDERREKTKEKYRSLAEENEELREALNDIAAEAAQMVTYVRMTGSQITSQKRFMVLNEAGHRMMKRVREIQKETTE